MDPEDWTRSRPILEAALERASAEREAFVRSRCGKDETLCERVLWYLRSEDEPGVLEDETPLGARAAAAAGLPVAGAQLGPWRLERELGRGGMGSVWLASRADGAFDKRVALKRIADPLAGDELLERFRREQRLLAELEHPGIARLIDAGRDEQGEPFLVMEYVEGRPIDVWCEQRGLSVRARLELFLEVCAAVAHAHRKLVVHRDLKPANILVADDGKPKLLDFGIARMLEDGGEATRTGEARFTPHYASLEQVHGEVVGTQTDVYSLGVVLYELLTGARPYRFRTGNPTEVLRVLTEQTPALPSAVARTGARRLEGDLDAIVLSALRHELDRRYPSVEAFAADLRRHLDGLPVLARPDTVRYRVGKFLGRHGVSVGAAAALGLALTAGLIATTHEYLRAEEARTAEAEQKRLALERAGELERTTLDLERERAAAELHFGQVRRLSTALVFDVERSIRMEGPTRARERLIELGLAHLDTLAERAGDDDELRLELAAAYLQMGDVLGSRIGSNLGRTAEAVEAYGKAIELVDGTADPAAARHGGWPLAANAGHKLGDALIVLGRPDGAQAAFEHALGYVEDAIDDPGARDQDLVVAGALVAGLQTLATDAGRFEAAEPWLAIQLELTDRLLERHPRMPAALHARAVALLAASDLQAARRDVEARLRSVEEASALLVDAVAAAPGVVEIERTLYTARVGLAEALTHTGDPESARDVLEETLTGLEALAAADPANEQLQRELALVLVHLGRVCSELGQDAASLEACLRAQELAEAAADRNPDDDVDLHTLAATAAGFKARALIGLDRADEAPAELERSAAHAERLLELAPGDPLRRRAATANCLELCETALGLEGTDLARGRTAVERGLALLEASRSDLPRTPIDEHLESKLGEARERLDARLAAAGAQ